MLFVETMVSVSDLFVLFDLFAAFLAGSFGLFFLLVDLLLSELGLDELGVGL